MALPVIVPKCGGAYEVAGTAAIDFKPHDPLDSAEKIYAFLQDPSYYYRFSAKVWSVLNFSVGFKR